MSVKMSIFAVLIGAMGIACNLAVAEESVIPAPLAKPHTTAPAAQHSAQQFDRVIGVCHLSENPFVPQSAVNVISPPMALKSYYRKQEHYAIEGVPRVSVLQVPAHGVLLDGGEGNYAYYPEKDYIGNDHASLLIEVDDKKVKMEYFFRVMQSIPQQYEGEPSIYEQGYCPKNARIWKISSSTNVFGNKIFTAVYSQMPSKRDSVTTPTDATALASTRG